MNKFTELVADQFKYGGKKYANTATKESTDILVDDYGFNWLLGTLNKYVYRYNNLGREKDLLKVACYCFIIWLKFGFHLYANGSAKDNYTTVETKSKYWTVFVGDTVKNEFYDLNILSKEGLLKSATAQLKDLRLRSNITRTRLIFIYRIMYRLWLLDGFDKKDTHDCDTWLEDKDEKK